MMMLLNLQYCSHSFIFSEEPTGIVIERKDFDLVESGRYIDYPWGKKVFDIMILHLNTKIKHDGKYFRLYGFPLALKVWFMNVVRNLMMKLLLKYLITSLGYSTGRQKKISLV